MQYFTHVLKQTQPFFIVAYLALGGMLCMVSASLYLGVQPDLQVSLTFLGIIFSIYILNRFTDTTEDFANDTARYVFFAKHNSLYGLGIVALVGVLFVLMASQKLGFYYFILVSLGVMYSYRLLPWYKKGSGILYYRLKEIPFIKNFVVAVLWGTSVFVLPILATQHSFPVYDVVMLSIALIVSTFSNTLFCDIRDAAGDSAVNSRTLPLVLGIPASYAIIIGANLCWVAYYLFAGFQGSISPSHLILFGTLTALPAVYISIFNFSKLSRPVIDFIIESDLTVFAAGVFILSFLR